MCVFEYSEIESGHGKGMNTLCIQLDGDICNVCKALFFFVQWVGHKAACPLSNWLLL